MEMTVKDFCTRIMFDLLENEEYNVANDYAEPGYDLENGGGGIIFADWNDKSHYDQETRTRVVTDDKMPRLAELAERLGFDIEWVDEWAVCDCQKAFRTQPDSYSWRMFGYFNEDGGYQCGECVKADPDDYIDWLVMEHTRANTILDDEELEAAGFAEVPIIFEHGLYGGQDASPERIAEALAELRYDKLFSITSVGQFDTTFVVWVRSEFLGLATELLGKADIRCDMDPAKAMESALKDATRKMNELEGEGIKYAQCHEDGTASVRLVSPEEFVAGIR